MAGTGTGASAAALVLWQVTGVPADTIAGTALVGILLLLLISGIFLLGRGFIGLLRERKTSRGSEDIDTKKAA